MHALASFWPRPSFAPLDRFLGEHVRVCPLEEKQPHPGWLYNSSVSPELTGKTSVAILIAVGLPGLALRCLDYPLAPVVAGLILGPMAEIQFRRALRIAQGDA